MNIKLTTNGTRISLESPYHPDLPAQAKALGGRWDGAQRAWSFDIRDEERVRELARSVYGTDGSAPVDLVTVRLTVGQISDGCHLSGGSSSVWFAGREIASRRMRDAAVRLGDGVVIVEGRFPSSGGSGKYPSVLGTGSRVVLEVRDVPRALVETGEIVDATPAPPVNPLAAVSDDDLLAELARRGYTVNIQREINDGLPPTPTTLAELCQCLADGSIDINLAAFARLRGLSGDWDWTMFTDEDVPGLLDDIHATN